MIGILRRLKGVRDKNLHLILVTHDALLSPLVSAFTLGSAEGLDVAEFVCLELREGKLVVTRAGPYKQGDDFSDVIEAAER